MIKEMFGVVSSLEGNSIQLEDVRNLLTVFDEFLLEECSAVNPQELWTCEHFKKRFSLVYSMLCVIIEKFECALNDLDENVSEGYRILREAKRAQTEQEQNT